MTTDMVFWVRHADETRPPDFIFQTTGLRHPDGSVHAVFSYNALIEAATILKEAAELHIDPLFEALDTAED